MAKKGNTISLSSLSPRHQQQAIAQGALPDSKFGRAIAMARRQGKFNNQRTVVDGEVFDSKHEANVCAILRLQHSKENVIRQVSIPLAGKRMRLDFLVIHERLPDGKFIGEFMDAKGVETDTWNAKANHLKDKHGIRIRKIKKGRPDEHT